MSYENRTLEHGKGISRKYTRTKQGIKRDRYRMKDPTQYRPRNHKQVIEAELDKHYQEFIDQPNELLAEARRRS